MKKFVAIGHIVDDILPSPHMGGGVAYASITAKRLGLEAMVVTKCPKDHPYLSIFSKLGIRVYVLPTKSSVITTFENAYDIHGNRTQKVLYRQESIHLSDLAYIPEDLLQDAIILIAPIIAEVDRDLFSPLAKQGELYLAPQGYFRSVGQDGLVTHLRWNGFDSPLPVNATVLSEMDLEGIEKDDKELERIKSASKITVVTQGENGSTIYSGERAYKTYALNVDASQVKDFTGAGDVYAGVFSIYYNKTKDSKLAAVHATFLASLKIYAIGGTGIHSIPTVNQVQQFIRDYPEQYELFLQQNGVSSLSFEAL